MNLEHSKKRLHLVDTELTEAKSKLESFKGNRNDMESTAKETKTRLRELEERIQEVTEARDKYHNRMTFYETETKQLRTTLNDQTEQIGALQINTQRLTRERDKVKRNFEMSLVDFESHKTKCGETLKRLKSEVIELSSKLVEKSKMAMKNREEIDTTKTDLEVLRKILDTDINITVNNMTTSTHSDNNSTDIEKLNLQILRNTHDKFRHEFQSHVEKLEDMLKESRTSSESITVVQSPMSRIKLEEIKSLRSETFDLHTDVTSIKGKISKLLNEIREQNHDATNNNTTTTKTATTRNKKETADNEEDTTGKKTGRELDVEAQFSKMNELVTKIESRHQAVMDQNSLLLEKTLLEDDSTAKDLVKKFQLVSLQGENRQMKMLLGLLQKKYKFAEKDIEDEMNIVCAGDKTSMTELLSLANQIGAVSEMVDNTPVVVCNDSSSSSSSSCLNEQYVNSQSRRNKTYNLFNKILTTDTQQQQQQSPSCARRNFSKNNSSTSSRSSTPTHTDVEDGSTDSNRTLPTRSYSMPKRWKRPKSSYSWPPVSLCLVLFLSWPSFQSVTNQMQIDPR